MKQQTPPANYTYCFASQAQCPKCETCLRHLATLINVADTQPLMCVHPRYIDLVAQGTPCEYYREQRTVTLAYGFKHMFDDIPVKQASRLKAEIQFHFLSRDKYYRARKGERALSPNDQAFIAEQFKRLGIAGAPKYDRTEADINW